MTSIISVTLIQPHIIHALDNAALDKTSEAGTRLNPVGQVVTFGRPLVAGLVPGIADLAEVSPSRSLTDLTAGDGEHVLACSSEHHHSRPASVGHSP
jgi:hypothetical protein